MKKSISLRGHSDWICSIDIQGELFLVVINLCEVLIYILISDIIDFSNSFFKLARCFVAYEDDILIASGGQDNVIRIWRFFARRAVRNCNEDEIQLKTIVLTSLNGKSEEKYIVFHFV